LVKHGKGEAFMSQENLENVRRLFQAIEDRNVAGVLAVYAPEIVIRDAESLPYGGIYLGVFICWLASIPT
jgi:uncharacterized protein